MSSQINVNLGSNSYPICISSDSFGFKQVQNLLNVGKIVIFSNDTVCPLYMSEIIREIQSLSSAQILSFNWPDGEQYKNMHHWSQALDFLAEHQVNRNDLLISLGGGVVCDMTGYVAASWMRGVDFIQMPTTLLAQIDASVGGKTAINHSKGKNLIGAFHQPKAVLINSSVLKTLSEREYTAGIGEAIKYGYINQPQFICWLQQNHKGILDKNPATLSELIKSCCDFKAEIVSEDEKEQGCRALLNFGHTFGHAIETLTHYNEYLHGEAVALGMIMAMETSYLLGLCSQQARTDLSGLIASFGLATVTDVDPEEMIQTMRLDKKASSQSHNLILYNEHHQQAEIVKNVNDSVILTAINNCL